MGRRCEIPLRESEEDEGGIEIIFFEKSLLKGLFQLIGKKMNLEQTVYLDHANATPVRREVLDKMLPVLCNLTGCPEGSHRTARRASLLVEEARRTTLSCLGVESGSVRFTAGGRQATEAAILGLARASGPGHIITCKDEDEGVLEACQTLVSQGYRVTYLAPDRNGFLNPDSVEKALEEDTVLLSLSAVNRLTGCLQSVEELARICRANQVLFHLEWSLGCLYELEIERLGIDCVTLSSQLIRGPQGTGAIWTAEGLELSCLETDNLAGIVGFTQALCFLIDERSDWVAFFQGLQSELLGLLTAGVPQAEVRLHSPSHPAITTFEIDGLDNRELVYQLDRWGVSAYETEYGVRFSSGRTTITEDLRRAVSALAGAARCCRQLREVA